MKALDKIRTGVESAVRDAGCLVPIQPATPIVAEGAPPIGARYDSRDEIRYAFFIGDDGRLQYGYGPDPNGRGGSQTDVESCFARAIAEGTIDPDSW